MSWDSVRELFHAEVAVERLHPGAVFAVYHRGRLVVDLVAGLADTQRAVPVSTGTLFALRSAGKPFASVAILQLAQRGRLELDSPVATYWPRVRVARQGRGDRAALSLTHRGGFADGLGDLEPNRWLDSEAVAGALEELPLRFPPGTTSSYYHLASNGCAQNWCDGWTAGRSLRIYARKSPARWK